MAVLEAKYLLGFTAQAKHNPDLQILAGNPDVDIQPTLELFMALFQLFTCGFYPTTT